jgi:hypothetical protein
MFLAPFRRAAAALTSRLAPLWTFHTSATLLLLLLLLLHPVLFPPPLHVLLLH